MTRYKPPEIESKWQKKWLKDKTYQAKDFDQKPKFIMLTEFPYPSGDGLHMGHVREYALADIFARYKRMNGYNVLYPMGYDAFGLPTENFAIKNKITPQKATEQNVNNFQKQFDSLGFSIDWDRTFKTSDPSYYKWTQWIFLQFLKAGLAVKEETLINWCPFCKTGLANEEVVNGRHERCDNLVEKKVLKQWVLKITKYADRLIDGLKDLDFPSKIADQQINWIGKSVGASIDFEIENHKEKLKIFTTAHDTIYGVTFMVIAPEHPLTKKITTKEQKAKVDNYIKQASFKSDLERQEESKEKTGVFSGAFAINPLTKARIPIYIADYVLMGYGTGAIMAVPGQDERDYDFAKKYDLDIVYTTSLNKFVNYQKEIKPHPDKFFMANSGEFDSMTYKEAKPKILKKLEELKVGKTEVQYRIRDWIFSRQRYWGEPIPVIYCEDHGPTPVRDEDLPVVLPELKDYEPTDDGRSVLSKVESFVNTTCPICSKPAKRETDTMPNWAGSSWYYLRYFDSKNDKAFADPKKLKYWGAVDFYLGGMEHTTLHLLYSRFWHQFLYDQKLVPTMEPYASRRGQGIILAADGTKMSKSKGNVVNPTDILDQGYGADSLRLAISFLAPYDQTTPWSPESVVGSYRFLDRVYRLYMEYLNSNDKKSDNSKDLNRIISRAIKKVTKDIQDLSFNTAIAQLMETLNELYKLKNNGLNTKIWQKYLSLYLKLLAPFAPHLSEELWENLGNKDSIHLSTWPEEIKEIDSNEKTKIVVQINGKMRALLTDLSLDLSEQAVKELALKDPKVKEHLNDQEIKKLVFVKNRIINFVV